MQQKKRFFFVFYFSLVLQSVEAAAGTDESSARRDLIGCEEQEGGGIEGSSIEESYVGMEFDSEAAAKEFCAEYSRCIGFMMRIEQCRRY